MTEVPKIVRDRLLAAGSRPGSGHPDADILAAFSEQVLPDAEREGVLAHLALCPECREVIALALPPQTVSMPAQAPDAEPATQPVFTPARSRRSLGWFLPRWGALAAGVILAGSLLLLYRGNHKSPAAPNAEIAVNVQPATVVQSAPAQDHPEAPKELAKVASPSPTTPPSAGASRMLKTERKFSDTRQQVLAEAKPASPAAPVLDAPTGIARETVEVSGGTEVASATPAAADALSARNEVVAIAKAKPPVQEAEAMRAKKSAGAMAAPAAAGASAEYSFSSKDRTALRLQGGATVPAWTVAGGALRHSSDGGHTWQDSLRADHPLLCVASQASSVWAGGASGALYHSADSGQTWLQVKPASGGQPLDRDISRIELNGRQVILTLGNHEVWTSPDDGQTWQKTVQKQ